MFQLLVTTPQGLQELIQISESGGYYDEEKIIYDSRIHGGDVELEKVGGYIIENEQLVYSQEAFDANKELKDSIALTLSNAEAADKRANLKYPLLQIVLAIVDLINEERAARRALINVAANQNLTPAAKFAAIAGANPPANIDHAQVVNRIEALMGS